MQTIDRPGACSIAARRAGCSITVLTLQERRVMALLRMAFANEADRPASMGGELSRVLARLVAEVRENGLSVFEARSRFVSDDELAILSWLSMLQRPSQSGQWLMANTFQEALRGLADALLREESRLPARSILSDARLGHKGCFRIELRPETTVGKRPYAAPRTVDAKVLMLVERHHFVTASQFRALGISSQQISRLYRSGQIERVSLGLYKKPERAGSMHAS